MIARAILRRLCPRALFLSLSRNVIKMSGQSIFKPIYDEYAVDFFRNRGWHSCAVRKKGWYCDVIAVRGADIALIEVKSPAEQSTGPNYDDMVGLDPTLVSQFPSSFRDRRRRILQGIPRTRGVSLVKLYAVSIGCQLFRYLREFEHKRNLYASAAQGIQIPAFGQCSVKTFLAVPLETKPQCQRSTGFLRSAGIISSTAEDEECKLFCAEVFFA